MKILKICVIGIILFNISFLAYGEKIGISYYQVLTGLSDVFKMAKSTPVKGEDRYMGLTVDSLAALEIIGDKGNITSVFLMVTTPNDAPHFVARNAAIFDRLVKNLFPEIESEASDWTVYALNKIAESNTKTETKIFGNKKIIIQNMLPLGIGITVKYADIEYGENEVTEPQPYTPSAQKSNIIYLPNENESPSAKTELPDCFTVGTRKYDVLMIQGPPTSLIGETLWFGTSYVRFSDGKVVEYNNAGNNLKIRSELK